MEYNVDMNKDINVYSLMTLRKDVKTIPDDYYLRQAVEKFRYYGYSSLPMINADGIYIGTICEGDLLNALADGKDDKEAIMNINRCEFNPPLRAECSFDEACEALMQHHFVPLTDSRGVLIGIITRKTLLRALLEAEDIDA